MKSEKLKEGNKTGLKIKLNSKSSKTRRVTQNSEKVKSINQHHFTKHAVGHPGITRVYVQITE